jgi:hypothetical protein
MNIQDIKGEMTESSHKQNQFEDDIKIQQLNIDIEEKKSELQQQRAALYQAENKHD